MKPVIQEILQYVIDHPEMTTRVAVDSYFDQILWSIEKQEWDDLTDQEKQFFADQLDFQKQTVHEETGVLISVPSPEGGIRNQD